MKLFLSATSIAFLFLFLCPPAFSTQIGVVDIERIFSSYYEISRIEDLIETRREQYADEIERERARIDEFNEQIQQQRASLSEVEYNQRILELEVLRRDLDVIIANRNNELVEFENEVKAPALLRIQRAIEYVRQNDDLDVVLNKNNVLSYNPELDVTSEVLRALLTEEELEITH